MSFLERMGLYFTLNQVDRIWVGSTKCVLFSIVADLIASLKQQNDNSVVLSLL